MAYVPNRPTQVVAQFGMFEGAIGGNVRGAMGRIEKWDNGNRWYVREAQAILAEELEVTIRREFAPHDKTGVTMRSMRVRPLLGIGTQITIGGGASFVETGTKEHIIVAHEGGVLRFPYEQARDGGIQFTAAVNHPGSLRDPFVERAMDEVQLIPKMQRVVVQAYQRFELMEEDFDMHDRVAIARAEAWAEEHPELL